MLEKLDCPLTNAKGITSKRLTQEVIKEINNKRIKKINAMWLEVTGCSGNIISFLNSENPDLTYILTQLINLTYNNTLMGAEGEFAFEQFLVEKETKELENIIKNIQKRNISKYENLQRQREFTLEELAKYNGEGEMPAYVAVEGIVYDVSMHIGWAGGTHFGLYAGKDLTKQFSDCHLGILKILSELPKVGILKK